jgi:hypothetical protein
MRFNNPTRAAASFLAVRAVASFLAAILVVGLEWPGNARGQGDSADAALKDRVLQLVERLEAPMPPTRDSAEAALIKLGPKILPLLPDPATVKSPERKQRLEKIRAALAKAEGDVNPKATRVTIEGKGIRLSEAMIQLQKQTNNPITDMREQLGVDVTNPTLDLAIKDKPFFEALDEVARLAQVTTTFFTGDGSIGIAGGGGMMAESPGGKMPERTVKPMVVYSGPFRIELKQVNLSRDFQAGSTVAQIQLEAAWEPRLRPMLLSLKSDQLEVFDDGKKKVDAQTSKETDEVVVRPENPVAEINLNLNAPDRSAKKIGSLKVKADVTIPAGLKLFKFPSLAKSDVTLKEGDVSVTLKDTEIEEQVWKVNVELAYPGEGPAFDSYRQGLFNNRLWLQRADGSRFAHNGGFSNTNSDGGKLGFEYLFVDAPGKPGDYQLIYETPSTVITIPLEFEFKDIPLP